MIIQGKLYRCELINAPSRKIDAYEKFLYLWDMLGEEALLEAIFQWFPTSRIEECLDDIAHERDADFWADEVDR